MARSFICVGDRIDHGGVVVSGTIGTDVLGKLVSRAGDRVVCEKHGPTVIVTGDSTVIIDGQPLAREGDKTACGATLIASQSIAYVDYGPAAGATVASPAASAAAATPEMPSSAGLLASKSLICAECLLAGSQSGAPLLGR